jgi:hypothetical protein
MALNLPASRNQTYVSGATPHDADDLNQFQDLFIKIFGPRTRNVGLAGILWIPGNGADPGPYDYEVNRLGIVANAGDIRIKQYLDFQVGERISGLGLDFWLMTGSSDTIEIKLWSFDKQDATIGAAVQVGDTGTTTLAGGSNAHVRVELANLNNHVVAEGFVYILEINFGTDTIGDTYRGCDITSDLLGAWV